jgi:hypothetical protein
MPSTRFAFCVEQNVLMCVVWVCDLCDMEWANGYFVRSHNAIVHEFPVTSHMMMNCTGIHGVQYRTEYNFPLPGTSTLVR